MVGWGPPCNVLGYDSFCPIGLGQKAFGSYPTSHLKDGKTLAKMVLERAYCCNYGVSAACFLAVWKEGVLFKWKLWATLLDQLF